MSGSPCRPYHVVPLSVQAEGEEFLVGNAELQEFFQIPMDGVQLLRMLDEGATIAAVETAFAAGRSDGDTIDGGEFVAAMIEVGLVYPAQEAHRHADRIAALSTDRRWLFRADRRVARAIFSRPALLLYLLVVGAAIAAAAFDPAARLQLDAFVLKDHLVITLVLLLIASSATTALHELGHLLAAAAHGIQSRLGLSMRLWIIVAEADLSGIMALPKRSRYLPLMAGMMVDVLNIALITLVVAALVRHGVHGLTIGLLQALALQLAVTLIWQFNVFLRTDVYFVLCTWAGHPDLDRDARVYLSQMLARGSFGQFGDSHRDHQFTNMKMVRAFAAIWVFGRIASLAMLIFVVIPTLWHYIRMARYAFVDPATSSATAYDLGAFAILSVMIVAIGLFLWIRQRPRSATSTTARSRWIPITRNTITRWAIFSNGRSAMPKHYRHIGPQNSIAAPIQSCTIIKGSATHEWKIGRRRSVVGREAWISIPISPTC